MKDGRTHLAHKAEHAVDLASGALVAVTLQGANVGDTTSLVTTARVAAQQVEAAHVASSTPAAVAEIVADKGYHSNQTMIDLATVAVRSYIAEPDRGRRHWTETPAAQAPVYSNRRRIRGARGTRLMRRRGEYVERSFAHVYDTGACAAPTCAGIRTSSNGCWSTRARSISAFSCDRRSGAARREGSKDADSASVRLKSPSQSSSRASGRPPCVCGPPPS
jgi:hypothetical protein